MLKKVSAILPAFSETKRILMAIGFHDTFTAALVISKPKRENTNKYIDIKVEDE